MLERITKEVNGSINIKAVSIVIITLLLFFSISMVAQAQEEYEIDVSVEGPGTVEIDPDQDSYSNETEVNLTAIPDSGAEFINWTGDIPDSIDESSKEITVVMDQNRSITANFRDPRPKITIIDPDPDETIDSEDYTVKWDMEKGSYNLSEISLSLDGEEIAVLDPSIESYTLRDLNTSQYYEVNITLIDSEGYQDSDEVGFYVEDPEIIDDQKKRMVIAGLGLIFISVAGTLIAQKINENNGW